MMDEVVALDDAGYDDGDQEVRGRSNENSSVSSLLLQRATESTCVACFDRNSNESGDFGQCIKRL